MVLSVFLFLGLFASSHAQGPIAFDDVCQREQGVGDNLSCPRGDGDLQCYVNSWLCDDVVDCGDGSDEGRNIDRLDCTGSIFGNSTEPIPAFVCDGGMPIVLSWLCDGDSDCPGGEDESSPLCENKCWYPHYGSCSYSRECSYTDLTSSCGLCRPGWASNPDNSMGECFTAYFSLSQPSYEISEGAGNFNASVNLITDGQLEQDIEVVVEILGGSAFEHDDYIPVATTLTFPQSYGTSSLDFSILIVNDNIQETMEEFALSATIPSLRGNFSSHFAVVTIIDDDTPPTVRFEETTYTTGESLNFNDICLDLFQPGIMLGSGLCSVQIRLIQSPSESVPPLRVPVNFDTDSPEVVLSPNHEILHFNSSLPPRHCLELTIAIHTQAGRAFQVDAISLTSSVCVVQSDRAIAQVFIPGYDVEFNLQLYPGNMLTEGQYLTLCVEKTFGIIRELTVINLRSTAHNYFNSDCTSIFVDTSFFFSDTTSGEMCFNGIAQADNCIEWEETYTVFIYSPIYNSNAVFPRIDVVITVVDVSGSLAEFALISSSYTVMENDSFAQVGMRIINDVVLTFPIVVQLNSSLSGNATNTLDYLEASVQFVFPAGAVEGHVSYANMSIHDDDLCEETENVLLGDAIALSPSELEVALFHFDFLTVVIDDNDMAAPSLGGTGISIEVFAPVVAVSISIILVLLVVVVVLLYRSNRRNNTTKKETIDIASNDIALDERQSSVNVSHEYEYLAAVRMVGTESEVYANADEVMTDVTDNGSVGSDVDEYVTSIVRQPHDSEELYDDFVPPTVEDNNTVEDGMQENTAYNRHSGRGNDDHSYDTSKEN